VKFFPVESWLSENPKKLKTTGRGMVYFCVMIAFQILFILNLEITLGFLL